MIQNSDSTDFGTFASVYPELESGIKDRDGGWYDLYLHEKNGRLVGILQRRSGKTGEYEESPVEFTEEKVGGLRAEAQFRGEPRKLVVSLVPSGPSEEDDAMVDVRIFALDKDKDGHDTLTQIHEHPGRLLANEALQKIPEHREGKIIWKSLGVNPKMLHLNPVWT